MDSKSKLKSICNVALKEYLGLTDSETLLVITDEHKNDIGYSFFEAAKEICHEAIYIEMKSRELNGQEPPEPIAELMKSVDAVICPTDKSLTHTNARREASKLGVRVATMPGITKDMLIRCLSADPKTIIELSNEIASKMKYTDIIHVTTKLGTDIKLPVKLRKVIISTGVLKNIGESGNLPSGEVYIAPIENKSNGKIVIDGSVAGIGIIKEPIEIEIVDGFAVNFKGDEKAIELQDMLGKVGKLGYSVAEFGIGTNHKAKITGDILEDEKVMGTIHIAFGNNITMGGKNDVKIHIDGIIKSPTVYFDNELIMENGKFLNK